MRWIPRLFFNKLSNINIDPTKYKQFYSNFNRKFPVIFTLNHLSYKTGISFTYLNKIVSRSKSICTYNKFSIKKHNGGKRIIYAPTPQLKLLQKWIVNNILSKCEESEYSFAYQNGKNISMCAMNHLRSKWLIKIDICQFFESISEIQVYKVFKEIGYTSLFSFQLARICTILDGRLHENNKQHTNFRKYNYWYNTHVDYNLANYYTKEIGHLPQGAPTSPKLANLVAKQMDYEIATELNNLDITYTRYADDITISSSSVKLTQDLKNEIIHKVYSVIKKYGFRPNQQKLKVVYPGSKKIVLGLNVENEELHLSRKFKNNLECHLYFIKKDVNQHIEKRGFDSYLGLAHHVIGLLNYAKSIEPTYYEKLKKKKLLPSWDLLH